MFGYWGMPKETEAACRDGWMRSGDLGRIRPDGNLELTGRSADLYKSGGELVMPKEIEELLTRLPGVSQAFALGIPDEFWGEAGVVWVVPEPDAELAEERILRHCKDNLARFKVPKHVLFCAAAELPTTPTGKVRKFVLAERAVALTARPPRIPFPPRHELSEENR
jgi:fatty-acyl-CoA synthase